jgi:chemotaxis protein CheC
MQQLTEEQIDALQELMNIGVGRAASILNEMLDSRILLQIPLVKVLNYKELQQELTSRFDSNPLAAVRLSFTGSFSGIAELVFPTESASKLVALLTGEEPGTPDLDSVRIGTLSEIGNIVINGVMGSISNVLKQHMNYALPIYAEDSIDNLITLDSYIERTVFLLAQARFTIEQLELIGDIILIFETSSFDVLIDAIDRELGVPL